MATLASDSQKNAAVTTVLLAHCELAFKLERDAVLKDISACGIEQPFLEKLKNEDVLKENPQSLATLRAPDGITLWVHQTVPNVTWADLSVEQVTNIPALKDTASPAHATIWSAGEPFASTWLKPIAAWAVSAKGVVNVYQQLHFAVSPLLKELEIAGTEFAASLAAVRARLDAVMANADLSCVHVPLGDHVRTTVIEPGQGILKQHSIQAMLSEIDRLPAGDVTREKLSWRIRLCIDIFHREAKDMRKLEEIVPAVERIAQLLRPTAATGAATKQFVRSYGYAACCVLARVADPGYFDQRSPNGQSGNATAGQAKPQGGLQLVKLLVDIFCGDAAAARKAVFDITLAGSAGKTDSCGAEILQECMDAAIDACNGKTDGLTKAQKDAACAEAGKKADKMIVPAPPGVIVSGTPRLVAGFKYPGQFSVGTMSTDESCLKHVLHETGEAPSLNKLQAYFAEVVQACKKANDMTRDAGWNGKEPEVLLRGQDHGFVADWEICVKKDKDDRVIIYHVSSGYKQSKWYNRAN